MKELHDATTPGDVLASFHANADAFDLPTCSLALARMNVSGGSIKPWKRSPVPAGEMAAFVNHTLDRVHASLRSLEAYSAEKAASGGGGDATHAAEALGHTVYAVYSLARLHRTPRATLDDISRVLQQPVDASGKQLSSLLQAQDMVQLASAFKATHTPAPRLFHAMSMHLSERGDIARMKHEEVIGLTDTFSSVHMLSPVLFRKLSERIHELAGRDDDRFTPRALAVAANALARWQRVSLSGAAQRASSSRPTARESVQAAQSASLEAMARMMPRITRTCRSHRVAHLDPQAFTAQGIAMLAHAYAHALTRQHAMIGRASTLALESMLPMLAALAHALTHPQTLRTATPAHLAMFASSMADVLVYINEHEVVERRDAARAQLDPATVLKAIGDACIRILDPAASGQEFASLAVRARETGLAGLSRSARASIDALEKAGLPRTRDDLRTAVREVGDRRAQAAAVDVLERKYADAIGQEELQADLDAMRALQAEVASPSPVKRMNAERTPAPAVAAKYNPLQHPQGAALRAPCTMHDVAELAHAFMRAGVSHPELMHKLCDRVLRAETAFEALTRGTSTGIAPEEALHDCTPHDTAKLVHAMAGAAPPSVARRLLTAVADAFVRERGWHDAGYGVARTEEDDAAAFNGEDTTVEAAGDDLVALPASFDDEPVFERSARGARTPRLPQRLATRPMQADDTLPLVRRPVGKDSVVVSSMSDDRGAQRAHARGAETRTTWAGRLMTRCAVEDHLRLLKAYTRCAGPRAEFPPLIADDSLSLRLARMLHATDTPPVAHAPPASWNVLLHDVAARVGARAAEAHPTQLVAAADALARMMRTPVTSGASPAPIHAPLLRALAGSLVNIDVSTAPLELCDSFARAAARSMFAELADTVRNDGEHAWNMCETTLYHHTTVVQAACKLASAADARRRDAAVMAVMPVLLHVLHAANTDEKMISLITGALASQTEAPPRWIPAGATATVQRLQPVLMAIVRAHSSVKAGSLPLTAVQRVRSALERGVAHALRRHEQQLGVAGSGV